MAAGLLAVHRQCPRAAQLGCAVPYRGVRHRGLTGQHLLPLSARRSRNGRRCPTRSSRGPSCRCVTALPSAVFRSRAVSRRTGSAVSGPATARNCAPRTTPSGKPIPPAHPAALSSVPVPGHGFLSFNPVCSRRGRLRGWSFGTRAVQRASERGLWDRLKAGLMDNNTWQLAALPSSLRGSARLESADPAASTRGAEAR